MKKWTDLFLYLSGYAVVGWALYVLISPWYARPPLKVPTCLGSAPGGQAQAENDCDYCPFADECKEAAPWRK